MTSLNNQEIREQLNLCKFKVPYELFLFKTIDSTNNFLKNIKFNTSLLICSAEQQTNGRGRFSRQWHSPFGENIYLSCRWKLDCHISQLSGLSLIVALSIVDAIKSINLGSNLLIKWPNDILWNDKKLCGILIELISSEKNKTDIIIGIGLNVNSKNIIPNASSLLEITHYYHDRNCLIALLIVSLDNYLQQFLQKGMSEFMLQWNELDYLKGKNITVTHQETQLIGQYLGIHENGSLILEDDKKQIHYLFAADTSLHQKNYKL